MVLGVFRVLEIFIIWAKILQVMEAPVEVNDIPVRITKPLRQVL